MQQLALAELDESGSANAKTVLGNVRAMEAALSLAEHLDTDAILEMHNALLREQHGWAEHTGRLREQLVWIGTHSPVTATFVPPQHPLVPAAMEDLVEFIDREDLPVVAQAAVAHAQFEITHPFTDGNGRTGRAIVHAMFQELGLNEMAAQRALATLTDRGILSERTGKTRNRLWAHPGIIDVLEKYAESIRRD